MFAEKIGQRVLYYAINYMLGTSSSILADETGTYLSFSLVLSSTLVSSCMITWVVLSVSRSYFISPREPCGQNCIAVREIVKYILTGCLDVTSADISKLKHPEFSGGRDTYR
ncbi:hypothetical protein RRG08_033568 [Elysia crispata]|uniref:Uncharacterized protein n=1 Tax=Elysia crispata TaxID=231223 RepID=A0AAE0XNU7_9GAST|nr:hypothetical protein RRG08_033568 [Elysia crispata]